MWTLPMADLLQSIGHHATRVEGRRDGRGEQMCVPSPAPFIDGVEIVISGVGIGPGETSSEESREHCIKVTKLLSKAASSHLRRDVTGFDTKAHWHGLHRLRANH